MYSYLHNESGDTQYSDGARRIPFDEFSALRHGDVVMCAPLCFVFWVVNRYST